MLLTPLINATLVNSFKEKLEDISENEKQATFKTTCSNYYNLINLPYVSYQDIFKKYCDKVYFIKLKRKNFKNHFKNEKSNNFYNIISLQKSMLNITYKGEELCGKKLKNSEMIHLEIPSFKIFKKSFFMFLTDKSMYKNNTNDSKEEESNNINSTINKSDSSKFTVYLLCIGGETVITYEKEKIFWQLKKDNCFLLGIKFIKNEVIETLIEDFNDDKSKYTLILPSELKKLINSGKIEFSNFETLRLIKDCEVNHFGNLPL